jgi:hypothetical protein
MMKHAFLSGLFVPLGLLVAIKGFVCQSEVAAALQTAPGEAVQAPPATTQMGGVVIVPTLEKPKNACKLEEKDFAGYLLVYFKDQTQSAYMAISRDGYTFTDLNDGQQGPDHTGCFPNTMSLIQQRDGFAPPCSNCWFVPMSLIPEIIAP